MDQPEFFLPLADYNDNFIVEGVTSLASEFVLNHELAHLCNGHVGWLSAVFGFNEIDELSGVGKEIDPEIIQALEWSADAYAIHRTLVRAFGVHLGVSFKF